MLNLHKDIKWSTKRNIKMSSINRCFHKINKIRRAQSGVHRKLRYYTFPLVSKL